MKFTKIVRANDPGAEPTRINLEEVAFYDILENGTVELVMSSGHKIGVEMTKKQIDTLVELKN